MSYDPWAEMWYTNNWIMSNFPPNEDFHHFEILAEREREYMANLEFFSDWEYTSNTNQNDFDYDIEDDYEEPNNYYSSSESENEEFEYI